MINFFVGKSQPYFTVQDHLRNAFRQHLSTLSANDKAYRFLLRETTEALRELLSVPSGSQIIFCASTAEIRDRIANDLTSSGALIVDSGYESRQLADAFSRGKIGTQLVEANTRDVLSGHDRYDLLAFAANERYVGIVVSPPDATPSALIVSDISSCAPYFSIDFTRTNSVFFSFAEGLEFRWACRRGSLTSDVWRARDTPTAATSIV